MPAVKVLFLKANYFPVCGAGRLLETLLAHIDLERVEPVLVEIATEGRPSSVHFAAEKLAHLQHHTIAWHGARRSGKAVGALRTLVRSTGAAAVYSHDMRCDLLCRLASMQRGLTVPWASHVHGFVGRDGDLRIRVFEAIDRFCIRGATEVWVGSEHARIDVRRKLPARVPIQCFHNAVDPTTALAAAAHAGAARRELGLPEGAFAVGMHARLHPAKGHALLAEAVLRSSDPRIHAVLLGYGEEEARLRELAASPRAGGRIKVVGQQAPMDTLATVAALDLFAYSSLRESMPLAVLEAMWLARPILSTDVGDVADALEHGGAGVLVPAGDVAAMAAAIDSLANDATRRAALAARAFEVVSTRFAPERLGDRVTAALESLTRGAR